MPAPIDFYFDFSSPYGYFASTQIEALGQRLGREVRWHPILLGPLFKAAGTTPLTEVPLKGDYSRRDFQRCAELFGIPYSEPTPFPISTVHAARAMLSVQQVSKDQAVQLAQALYAAFFAEGRNISQADVVVEVAGELGMDTESLAQGMSDPVIKERLKQEVDDALARGVFGSPFVIVDDEPFWGFDRLSHIPMWMETRTVNSNG